MANRSSAPEARRAPGRRRQGPHPSGFGQRLIEPDDGLLAIGSGGPFALAAARALVQHTTLSATAIAEQAMRIAAAICIYTNDRILLEEL
jgi:ATP-dependent HslUV protease subunit HslV